MKKLKLNKLTISKLENNEMSNARGGTSIVPYMCSSNEVTDCKPCDTKSCTGDCPEGT